MTTFRIVKDKENPYVMINKGFLNDEKLSWKAKGVLTYLLSLPDDWQIYESEIVKHSKDGRDSLKGAIKELINNGYIERERERDKKGMLKGYNYSVYEYPIHNGKSNVGKPNVGKSVATNNNSTNNDSNNIIYMEVDNKTKEKIDYETIRKKYNNIKGDRIAQCKNITNKRKKQLNARINEYGIDSIYKVLDNISESDFLKNKFGLNTKDQKSKLDFDWIFNPNNFIKILEDKYKDKQTKQVIKEEFNLLG